MIAKGPNILNLQAYTQGQQESSSNYKDEYQDQNVNSDQRMPFDSKTIQDQFDNFQRQIKKYDEILNNVARNIQQINASNDQYITDFYPDFIINTTYQNDQQKKVIHTNDPQICKILINLQKINIKLKQQMKGWTFQFAKKSQITQNLLAQNGILRKAISVKNKQIVNLIQVISKTQNDQLITLKENLQILKQQNGVLLEHLQKISQEVRDKKQDLKLLNNALQQTKKHFLQVEKQSQAIQDKQDHLSKTATLFEQNLNQILKRKKKLQKQKNRLIQLKNDFINDQDTIRYQVQSSQNDKNQIERQLKSKFETNQSQKNKLIEQIQDHTQKIQKHKQNQRYLESQINRNQHRLQEFNKINKDLKAKFQTNKQLIDKLKTQFQKIIDSQSTIQSEIDLLNLDIKSLKEQLMSFDQIEKQQEQNNKAQIKILQQQNSKRLTIYRSNQMKQIKQLTKKIFQDRLELTMKQKESSQWQNKMLNKKDQILDLKNQMKQIRANQTKANQLRIKLRQKQLSS